MCNLCFKISKILRLQLHGIWVVLVNDIGSKTRYVLEIKVLCFKYINILHT